jgi:arginine/lysine/ornithine decarboxylase
MGIVLSNTHQLLTFSLFILVLLFIICVDTPNLHRRHLQIKSRFEISVKLMQVMPSIYASAFAAHLSDNEYAHLVGWR